MQTYHFDEIVNDEGVVTLSGLPPFAKVAVVVVKPKFEHTTTKIFDWEAEMKAWMNDFRQCHPFTKMSRDEVMEHLRRTREEIYEEDYGHRHAITG